MRELSRPIVVVLFEFPTSRFDPSERARPCCAASWPWAGRSDHPVLAAAGSLKSFPPAQALRRTRRPETALQESETFPVTGRTEAADIRTGKIRDSLRLPLRLPHARVHSEFPKNHMAL